MSNHRAIRRKISYAPIIVTSKSIRSLDYSDTELVLNDKKLNNAKLNRQKLPAFLTRKPQLQSSLTIEAPVREPTMVEELHLPEEDKQQNIPQMFKKMRNHPTVKVEFHNQTLKQKKKLEMKVLNLGSAQDEPSHVQKSGVTYFSNVKTFEQFSKLAKINPLKRSSNEMRNQVEEEWKKYLDKYHLNINTIKPIMNRIDDISLPPFKVKQIESSLDKPNKTKKSLIFEIFQSDRNMRAFTKRQTSSKRDDTLMSPSQKALSYPTNQVLDQQTLYKRIEQDIASSKSKGNKKDYFVFGLSQVPATSPEAILKVKFDTYRDFIFRINFTNGLYVKHRDEGDKLPKIFVGFGNNSQLVQGIMRRRFWWQTVDKITEDVNFVWTQLKISQFFKGQPHNKLKSKHQRQKTSLPQSDIAIEENSNENDFNKSIMYGENMLLWKRYNEKYSKYQQKGLDFGLPKRVNGLLKKKAVTLIQNSTKLKIHNHLQCNYFLGNKKALFYSMKKYYELINIPPFTKIPLTFHITQGIQDPEFSTFLEEFEKQKLNKNTDKQFRNVWIIKPGELTNRGRGITVCSTLDEIKNRIKAKQRNSNGTIRSYILQKYLQKPLLYQNRKFDIRHYMMITCHNGQMKGYWYQEGYIRTTSSEYNIKNTKDLMNHLTNDAVQKNGQNYGKFEVGNKVSYADFQKYLTNHVSANIDFSQQVLPKMKQLATESIRATYTMLDPERKQHNFQLFGLDFMLDEALNVYLIEVNTNPCLETSCPLLTKIITPLVQNVFKIGLDPLFPPPFEWPIQKKYLLGNNALEQNKFTLVFDELQQGAELKQLYKNCELDQRMGDIFQEQQQYHEEQKQWDEQQQTKKQK